MRANLSAIKCGDKNFWQTQKEFVSLSEIKGCIFTTTIFFWRYSQVAKAGACKALIPGSNPGVASIHQCTLASCVGRCQSGRMYRS